MYWEIDMRKKIHVVLSSLIALLSGCKTHLAPSQPTAIAIYGVPYARYHVHGTVEDQQGTPIENAEVIIKEDSQRVLGDTLQTNESGTFDTTVSKFPVSTLRIVVNDPSGVHASDSTQVTISESGTNANGFFRGDYNVEANIQLKKK